MGGRSLSGYDESNIPSIEGGLRIDWSSLAGDDVDHYRVERRRAGDDAGGLVREWRLLEDEHDETYYEESDGAPGFDYEYQVTTIDADGDDIATYPTEPYTMIARDSIWAYGISDTGLAIHAEADQLEDGFYKFTIYKTNTTVLTTNTQAESSARFVTIPNVTKGNVVKVKLEILAYNEDTQQVEPVESVETHAKVGDKASIPAPAEPDVTTVGGRAYVDWEMPGGIHRSQFAFYEVLRRDALVYRSKHATIGSSVETELKGPAVAAADPNQYTFRLVPWEAAAGPMAEGRIHPAMPHPKCTYSGTEYDVGEVTIWRAGYLGWYGYRPSYYPTRADHTFYMVGRNTSNGLCDTLNPAEWEVKRATRYKHAASDTCTPANRSCDLVDTKPTAPDYPAMQLVTENGTFLEAGYWNWSVNPNPDPIWIWHDEALPTTKGVYVLDYQLCSLYQPTICSNITRGPMVYGEGLTEIPFDVD